MKPLTPRWTARAFKPFIGCLLAFTYLLGGNVQADTAAQPVGTPTENANQSYDNWKIQGTHLPSNTPPTSGGSLMTSLGNGDILMVVPEMSWPYLGETWLWSGNNGWIQLHPEHAAPAVSGATMTYDAQTGQVVLFGGRTGGSEWTQDTWTWDGTDWTKQQNNLPMSTGPALQTYDAATHQLLLFLESQNSTYVWNGTHWDIVDYQHGPSNREDAMMAYDASSGQVVLFGGYSVAPGVPEDSQSLNDTWTWNGSAWTEVSTQTSPPGRANAAFAYDDATGTLILYGGEDQGTVTLAHSDTWSWDGFNWTKLSPATNPPRLDYSLMAYDGQSKQLVMFGGEDSRGFAVNDTWLWNGQDWSEYNPSPIPPSRIRPSMSYDNATGSVILFGGQNQLGWTNLDETWSYNGSIWARLLPAESPSARSSALMAQDKATGQLILFGGYQLPSSYQGQSHTLNDTWNWSGTTWTPLTPNVSPPPRVGGVMAYDEHTKQLILFGGTTNGKLLNDTWEWDGTTWKELFPKVSPRPRFGAQLAYDDYTGQLVLYGGTTSDADGANVQRVSSDTWVWDGSDWSELHPDVSPPPLTGAVMTYDGDNRELVLFGGLHDIGASASDPGAANETWTWDGATWLLRSPRGTPSGPVDGSMVYDDEVHQLVLYANMSDGNFQGDMWSLSTAPLAVATSVVQGAQTGVRMDTPLRAYGGSHRGYEWHASVNLVPYMANPLRTNGRIHLNVAKQSTLNRLPAGVSLSSNGELFGTPTQPGKYTFVVAVRDSVGIVARRTVTMDIQPKLMVQTSSLRVGHVNKPYGKQALTAEFGKGVLRWALVRSRLPAGMSLSSSGVLTGTPRKPGCDTITVRVTDQRRNVAQKTLTLNVLKR